VGVAKSGSGFIVAHCWAHVRRKFIEAEKFFPRECKEILDLIRDLYGVERLCPTGPPTDEFLALRTQLRAERSKVIIKRIEHWAMQQRALPRSSLGKGIRYMQQLWRGLTRFLDDPLIPLDNNHTERAIRGVVVGRKNHYGSRSERGTEVAAVLYSLLESAKLAGVEPKSYLRQAATAAIEKNPILLPHQAV